MKTISHAWAITSKIWDDPKPFFLGVFYFHPMGDLESHQDGMRTCLFRTRKQARTEAQSLHYRKDYHVVKVKVTIEEIGR